MWELSSFLNHQSLTYVNTIFGSLNLRVKSIQCVSEFEGEFKIET